MARVCDTLPRFLKRNSLRFYGAARTSAWGLDLQLCRELQRITQMKSVRNRRTRDDMDDQVIKKPINRSTHCLSYWIGIRFFKGYRLASTTAQFRTWIIVPHKRYLSIPTVVLFWSINPFHVRCYFFLYYPSTETHFLPHSVFLIYHTAAIKCVKISSFKKLLQINFSVVIYSRQILPLFWLSSCFCCHQIEIVYSIPRVSFPPSPASLWVYLLGHWFYYCRPIKVRLCRSQYDNKTPAT